MSLLELMSLAGSLAIASMAIAAFAILGRAFWGSRRTAPPKGGSLRPNRPALSGRRSALDLKALISLLHQEFADGDVSIASK